jgi:hypothetical protein
MASAPYDKMLISNATIYYAPIAEPFPLVGAVPAGNWEVLALPTDITEDGITIETSIQDARIFSLGGVAPVKAGIVQKQFTLSFNVMNAALEQQALAQGGDPDDVTDNGTNKSFSLPASPTPQGWAILVRWDQSPEGDALNSQFEIKSAVQVGAAGGQMSKSNPFAQAYSLVALYTDADWVVFRVGDQAGT